MIFNKTTLEIDYPTNPSHFDKYAGEDDVSIEILDKSLLPGPHKRTKTTPCGTSEAKFDLSAKVSGECPLPRGIEPENFTRKQNLSEEEGKTEALMRAKGFKSKEPFFIAIMPPSSVGAKFQMYVPVNFARLYLEGKTQTVTLWVGEEYWHVKLIVNGSDCKFCAGWAAFALENSLQPSDVCIFELIKRNQPEMEVTIFRQNDFAQE